jgi:hypothetical protein
MRADRHPAFFAAVPPLVVRDPLAELLGAVALGEPIEHTFAEVVKAAGHVCPTVAGAWLVTRAGLAALYGDALPVRGDVEVRCMGGPGQFGYGPMAQVIANLTGAAPETGFRGLGGRFGRANLLTFHPETPALSTFEFRRRDTGAGVRVIYRPETVPADPELRAAMAGALAADEAATAVFRRLWLDRVERILAAADDVVRVEPLAPTAEGSPLPARTA